MHRVDAEAGGNPPFLKKDMVKPVGYPVSSNTPASFFEISNMMQLMPVLAFRQGAPKNIYRELQL